MNGARKTDYIVVEKRYLTDFRRLNGSRPSMTAIMRWSCILNRWNPAAASKLKSWCCKRQAAVPVNPPPYPQIDFINLALTLLVAAAVLLPRALELGRFVVVDEVDWLQASANFYNALQTGELHNTYQLEHPAVPTLWAGALGFMRTFCRRYGIQVRLRHQRQPAAHRPAQSRHFPAGRAGLRGVCSWCWPSPPVWRWLSGC